MKIRRIAGFYPSSLSALLVALIANSSTALAQDSVSVGAESKVLDEIIVTADKRSAKSIQDLSSSITAFDANKIEQLNALDFDDFIVQVPGTNFLNDGGPGRGNEVASIRGLSAVADNTIGVVAQYLDGAPHFGNSYRLFDIGEVGVLRGPQGTLWGSQSIGGLIYFQSTRPDTEEFGGSIQGDLYTTSNDGGMSQRYTGVLNMPLVEDKFAVRVAGHFIDESGYIQNARTGTEGINNVEESAWRISGLFKPTDAVTVTAIYHGNDLTADAPTYFLIGAGDIQVDQPSDTGITTQEYDLFNLIVDADFGWGLLNYTGSSYANKGHYSDFAGDPGALQLFDTVIDEDANTHEIRLSSTGDSAFQWLVGFYTDDYDDFFESVDFSLVDFNDPAPAEGVRAGGLINRSENAIFGEFSYDISDDLRVLIGGRWFDWEVDNREVFLIGGGDFGFVTNGIASDDDFFYKLLVEYRFSDEVLAYASRSEGFRYGGFNTFVGEALFGISEEFYEFGPDTLVSYETGIKSSLMDGKMTLNASAYFLDWQEVQAVVQSDTAGAFGQGFFTTNAPDLEGHGLELEIVTQDLIAEGVYASLSYGMTKNEFQDDSRLFPGTRATILKGDELRRTVRNTWAMDIGYEFELGASRAYARANYWHKDSASSAGFNGNDGDIIIPSQDVLNISGGVIWDKVQFKLYVDNVTDKTPWLNVFSGNPVGLPGSDQAVRANTIRPRTVGLEATYYFGM
jgi:outer membrane receptor protein involved in Fe transport